MPSSERPSLDTGRPRPYVAPPNEHGAGFTNFEALAAIEAVLGHLPIVGTVYRVGFIDAATHQHLRCIAEFAGNGEDRCTNEAGELLYCEPVLFFEILNPVPEVGAVTGTREYPIPIWPLNVWHISPAVLDDLDAPLFFEADVMGAAVPGRSRLQ